MANDEIIGGVGIAISGDFSDLESNFQEAIQRASQQGTVLADAIQSSVKDPDTGALLAALTEIGTTAQSSAQAMTSAFADAQIAAPDTSQIVDQLAAIGDTAKTSASAMSSSFDVPIAAPDTSAVSGAMDMVAETAQSTAQVVAADFADIAITPPDIGGIQAAFETVAGDAQSISEQVNAALSSIGGTPPDLSPLADGLEAISVDAGVAQASLSELAQQANASVNAEWIEKATADLVALGGESDVVREQLTTMLESGASNGEAFIAALTNIESAAQAAAGGIAEVGDAAQQAGEQEAVAADGAIKFGDAAQSIVDKQAALDAELATAQAAFAEVSAAYDQGSVSAATMARSADELQSAFAKANPQIEEAGTAAKDAGEKAQAASTDFGGLASEILKLAGITVSIEALVELGKAAVEASDHLDDATYAISKFTGSTESAQGVIEGLKEVAQDEGLSFPHLVTAAQRLEALLPPGTDVVALMAKLGNSSELTGASIETLGRKFASMVESQTISAKSLGDFGIRIEDVRAQMEKMGASAEVMDEGLKKALKTMDSTQIVDLLEGSLSKLDGTAKQMNDDIGGDLKRTMNDFYIAIAKLGDSIGPLARDVLPGLVAALKGLVVAGDFVVTGLKLVIDAVIGMESVIAAATFGIGQAIAKSLAGDFSGATAAIKTATADISAAVKNMGSEMANDIKAGTDFMNKVWSVDMPAALDKTKKAAKDTSDELSGLSTKGKSAAQDISAAFASIDSLEQKISSGAGVQALQAAFENTGKAISKVATVDLQAAIKAVDDYTQAQIRNNAGSSVMMQAFQEESKLISQLAKVDLRDAVAAMDNLVGSFVKAKEPLGIIQAAFEQEEKMIQQLAKQDLAAASAAWDKLIQTLQNANAPLSVMNQALKDHTKFLDDNAAAADKAVAALDKAAISYSNFNTKGSDANKVMKDAADTLDRLGISAAKLPDPISAANKAMIDFGVGAGKAKTVVEDLHTPITTLIGDFSNLVKQAQDSGNWDPVLTALDNFDKRIQNLSKTDLPAAEDQLAQFIQGMIKMGAPAELVQGQIEKLQQIVQKMATEGLPQSAKGWSDLQNILKQVPGTMRDIQQAAEQQMQADQRSLDLMMKRGDAIGYILDQQGKLLQEEITYAEKTGQDANDLVLGLEKVRLKQEELKLSSHGLADEYVAMINDVLKGFDQMAGVMADAIVNGKNLGQALIGEFKKIGQSILTDLIQAALLPLKIALIEMISGLLPGMSAGLGIVGGSLGGMNAAAGGAATGLHALAEAAQEAAASISSSVAGMPGGSGGVGGAGIAGTVGMVSEIVAAGAAVASAVLLSHISSDTGHIEVNTRSELAQITNVWSTQKSNFSQMYQRVGEVIDRLNHIMDLTAVIAAAGGGGGGIPPESLGKLTGDGDATVKILANIYDLTQSALAAAQTTASDIAWVMQDADKANVWLGQINSILDSMYDVLLYGKSFGQSSAQSASTERAMQTSSLNALVNHAAQHGQALNSLVTQSITGNGIGRTIVDNTGAAADDMAALYGPLQSQADAAAKEARHAGNTEALLADLKKEYMAYEQLANAAHMQGNELLAQQYEQSAQQIQAQIAAVNKTSTTALVSALGATDMSLVDASKGVQYSTLAGAQLISTTVAQGSMLVATSVSSALTNSAAASASFMASMASSLINIKGSNSSAGPLPSQQITLNSQGAPSSPSTKGPSNGLPPIPISGHMGYATGGSIETDQIAQLHAGEVVLPATQVAASAAQMTAQAQQIADLQSQLSGLNKGLMGALANADIGSATEAQGEINAVQAKLDALTAAMDANTAATQADAAVTATGTGAAIPSAGSDAVSNINDAATAAQSNFADQLAALQGPSTVPSFSSPDFSSPDISGLSATSGLSGGSSMMDTSGIISAIQEGTATLDADLHSVSTQIMALAAHVGGAGLVSSIAGAQKWGVATPKSFDEGGFVDHDQMAMVHSGEFVVPPDLTGMLRKMASVPSSGYPGADGSTMRGGCGSGNVMVNAPITITGVTDGRQLAVMLEQHLKRVLNRTGKYTK